MYGFFSSVAQAARRQAGHELCWWEIGSMCERRYRVDEQWYNLRPDALAAYRVCQQHFHFWLEWDCGSMNVRDLSIKFASYAHFIASREWAREAPRLPRLFCVAPDIAQEKRIQRVRHERLEQTPGLVMCMNTEVLLNEHGPPAPIWLLFTAERAQGVVPGSALRRGWSTLISQANAL
jgi:Replication-relaxation